MECMRIVIVVIDNYHYQGIHQNNNVIYKYLYKCPAYDMVIKNAGA